MNSDGILYKGYTTDLQHRLDQHNVCNGFVSFTHHRGPWKLVYKEAFNNKKDAMTREKFFKTGKGRAFLKEKIGQLSA